MTQTAKTSALSSPSAIRLKCSANAAPSTLRSSLLPSKLSTREVELSGPPCLFVTTSQDATIPSAPELSAKRISCEVLADEQHLCKAGKQAGWERGKRRTLPLTQRCTSCPCRGAEPAKNTTDLWTRNEETIYPRYLEFLKCRHKGFPVRRRSFPTSVLLALPAGFRPACPTFRGV